MRIWLRAARGWRLWHERPQLGVALCAAAIVAASMALPAVAEGAIIKTWRAQPVGTTGTGIPVIVNGSGSADGYPLDLATVKLMIDTAEVPRSTYVATISFTRNLYLRYVPSPALTDGAHTIRVEISDTIGRLSSYQWTVTIAQPPSVSWTSPAPDAECFDGRPTIGLSMADNTPASALAISGEVRVGSATGSVAATFGGTGLSAGMHSFTLADELAPGTYYLLASVTDGGGNTAALAGTAARRFTVIAAPAMTLQPEGCLADGCHVRTGHPGSGRTCAGCHVYIPHEYAQCEDCHGDHGGPIEVTGIFGPCQACHDPAYPGVPVHTQTSVTPAHASGCNGCHDESLIARHAVTPDGTMYAYQCDLCHASTDPRVAAAVAAGDLSCGACHDVGPDHGAFDAARHTSVESCLGGCHSAELTAAHDAEVTVATTGCADCHATKVAEIRPWDATCGACHPTATPSAHPTPGASHAGSDALVRDYTNNFAVRTSMSTKLYPFGCTPTTSAGQMICHDVSNLATLHGDLPGEGCSVCHASGSAPEGANECLTCHGTGWYTPSISKGTIARPGSDFSTSGTVTVVGGSGADNYSALLTNDGATSHVRFTSVNAEALFGRGTWWLNPNTTTITSVQVSFRALKLGLATTTSRMTAVLDVGGTTYASTAAATNPSATAYTLYTHTFTTNPKTGVAWTYEDLNDPGSVNGLRAFGVRQTVSDAANIGVTEVFLKINTPDTAYTTPTVSGGNAHHYGDYLRSPQAPEGEWSSAIYTQYCYDRCHVWPNTYAYYGEVLGNATYNPFNAYQGTQMWSSLMGDPNGNSPLERNLTLEAITLPAGSPVLEFMTNYVLGAGDSGRVEISADGGSSWTTLEGTLGGAPVTTLSGTAGSWRLASYDLSAYAGQSVTLRFRYNQAPTSTSAGWCIDNVSVSEGGTVLFSDDAETLKPEWDSGSHWRRIQYSLRWLG